MPFTFETGNNLPRCEPISSLQKKPLSANTSGQFRPSQAPASSCERGDKQFRAYRLCGLVADPRDAERPPQHRRPQTGNPPQTEKTPLLNRPWCAKGGANRTWGIRSAAIFPNAQLPDAGGKKRASQSYRGQPQGARASPVHVDLLKRPYVHVEPPHQVSSKQQAARAGGGAGRGG